MGPFRCQLRAARPLLIVLLGAAAPAPVAAVVGGARHQQEQHQHLTAAVPLPPPLPLLRGGANANVTSGKKGEEGASLDSTTPPALSEETDEKLQQQRNFVQQHGAVPWFMTSAQRARHGVAVFMRKCHILEASKSADNAANDWQDLLFAIVSTLITLLLWALLVFVVATIYRNLNPGVTVDIEKAKEQFKGKDFVHGAFTCHEEPEIACWSFWCGALRWADTMSAMELLGFWVAVIVFTCATIVNAVSGITMWIIIAAVFTYYRQEVRKKFGMKNEGEDALKDFALWCCGCACCAISQEARQIKAAPKMQLESPPSNVPIAA